MLLLVRGPYWGDLNAADRLWLLAWELEGKTSYEVVAEIRRMAESVEDQLFSREEGY